MRMIRLHKKGGSAGEIYARCHQLGEEAISYAHTITIEARARLGELWAQMPKTTGGHPPKSGTINRKIRPSEDPVCSNSPSLLGIRRVLTLLASVPRYPVLVFDTWREKGKDHRPTMEDFLNWELGQYKQQRARKLEHPIRAPQKTRREG